MQDAPDRDTLLAHVAMFLMTRVEPALKAHPGGKGLAFRTRIAAHLIATVGRELAFEEDHDGAESTRLASLLDETPAEGITGAERRAAIADLRGKLACRLRDDATPIDEAAVRAALRETLTDVLAVVQPRFDTRMRWAGDDPAPAAAPGGER